GFPGAWRRCNSSEWNNHSSSLRLALHPENRTLQPVQRRFLGLILKTATEKLMSYNNFPLHQMGNTVQHHHSLFFLSAFASLRFN
ncbi:MAG: hypothetical protein WC091_20970, partial [Sulfuricellaceae bacterium]